MVSRRKREQNKSRGIMEGGGSGPSIHVRDSRSFAGGNIKSLRLKWSAPRREIQVKWQLKGTRLEEEEHLSIGWSAGGNTGKELSL